MQALYALWCNQMEDIPAVKKFLQKSLNDLIDLYLLELNFIVEVKNHAAEYLEKSKDKFLPTEEDKNPNLKFINNEVIALLENNEELNELLEKKKLNDWRREPHYAQIVWDEVRDSKMYARYTQTEESSFEEDKEFVVELFREFIAPEEKLHDYFEDNKLTWMDDLPLVNTAVVKSLNKIKPDKNFRTPKLFKNADDRDFGPELLSRTLMYDHDFEESIIGKTPNWDKDRLAEIDTILIKMALCEFTYFPSIPVKVTINEYIEIAKEYSTQKSSIFINGVLDKISKEYKTEGKLNKIGRGLL